MTNPPSHEMPAPTDEADASSIQTEMPILSPEELAAQKEAEAKAQAEFEARLELAKQADPRTFLTLNAVTLWSETMYRDGHRWYVTEDHPSVRYQGVVRIGTIHLANQAILHALLPALIFTLEDLQKAFNNVSIVEVDGASEEKQSLLTQTAMALTDLAWDAAYRMRVDLPELLDDLTVRHAEKLRIPHEKDGGTFTGVDLLFEPSAGQFRQFAGIVLRYTTPTEPTWNGNGQIGESDNTYVLLQSALRGQSDEQLAGAVFLRDIINYRNAETDKAIVADIQGILTALVQRVGVDVLKKDEVVTDVVNDSDGNSTGEVVVVGIE